MKIILLIMFLLLLGLANAQQILVIKETKNEIQLDDILEIKININNPYNKDLKVEVLEALPKGVTLIDPSKPDKIEFHDALEESFFRWEVNIPANKITTLKYKIKPDNLGEYTLPKTKVTSLANNEVYLSDPLTINVLCNPNNICEENENSLNCAADCSTGLKDGICDYKADGKCDLDCDYDPDCGKVREPNIINKYLVFYIIGIVFILIFIFLLRKSRKS